MQQKLPPYVVRSPFCVVLKVEGACPKLWEFKRGGNVTGITSTKAVAKSIETLFGTPKSRNNAAYNYTTTLANPLK